MPPIRHSGLVVVGYITENLVCDIPIHSDYGRQSLSHWKDIFPAIFRIGADAKVRPRFCQGVTGCDEKFRWTSLYIFVILFGLSYSWNMLECLNIAVDKHTGMIWYVISHLIILS